MAINNSSSTAVETPGPGSTHLEAYSVAAEVSPSFWRSSAVSEPETEAEAAELPATSAATPSCLFSSSSAGGLDVLWSPLELFHMLVFHHTLLHPAEDFGVATFAVYVFLCAGLGFLIAAFSAENVLRLSGRFRGTVSRAWPAAVCVTLLLVSLLTTLAFLSASLTDLREETPSSTFPSAYLHLDSPSSVARVSILGLLVVLVVAAVVVLMVVAVVVVVVVKRRKKKEQQKGEVKNSDSYPSSTGGCNNEPHPPSLPLHFLLRQAEGAASSEAVDTGAASPLSLDVTLPSLALKGRNSPRGGGDFSADSGGLRGPSMLGVNMAQVLGRRRHTICQMGDSGPSPADPPAPPRSKQYSYVRKFSVDISALQAQLSNPKLHKDDVPFQSDQDLTQRKQTLSKGSEAAAAARPLLPLMDLGRGVVGKAASSSASSMGGGGGGGGSPLALKSTEPEEEVGGDPESPKVPLLPPPPPPAAHPPVITVSEEAKEGEEEEEEEEEGRAAEKVEDKKEEKDQQEEEEEEKKNKVEKKADEDHSGFTNSVSRPPQYSPITNKDELTSIPKLPITQPVNEEDEEEEEEEEEEEAEEEEEMEKGHGRKESGRPHLAEGEGEEEDSTSSDSARDNNSNDFVKMTLMMALTFVLCTFPLLVLEAAKGRVHAHTYVNVGTCLRALSSIQTIVYPHVVLCMDRAVRRAVRQLRRSGICCHGGGGGSSTSWGCLHHPRRSGQQQQHQHHQEASSSSQV
ncbi:uncharacterized protein LOC143298568 [Babylonia areolata]|uniref:uncharacterized protein LOC143298568 n=1 Tax=Babylonia areolata TaxID=304850 RepID=UPI003FD567EC